MMTCGGLIGGWIDGIQPSLPLALMYNSLPMDKRVDARLEELHTVAVLRLLLAALARRDQRTRASCHDQPGFGDCG